MSTLSQDAIKKILMTELHRLNNRVCSIGGYNHAIEYIITNMKDSEEKEKLLNYITKASNMLKDITQVSDNLWFQLTEQSK